MTKLPPLSVLLAPHGRPDFRPSSAAPCRDGHYSYNNYSDAAAYERQATPLFHYAHSNSYSQYEQQQSYQRKYTSPASPSSPTWGPPFASASRHRNYLPPSPPPAAPFFFHHSQSPEADSCHSTLSSSGNDSVHFASPRDLSLDSSVPLMSISSITSSSTATSAPARRPKQSRYLREMDRRAIIKRLDSGEKQCALAKEFNVSRSSICNLFKHRAEVLSRAHHLSPFSKHPKKKCKKHQMSLHPYSSSSVTKPVAAI